jgi:hypothetical protein
LTNNPKPGEEIFMCEHDKEKSETFMNMRAALNAGGLENQRPDSGPKEGISMKANLNGTRTCLVILAMACLVAAPASADLGVKFFGTATAGDLSPEIAQAVADSGVDLAGFGCFELPLLDLETGHEQGVGVDCLKVFDDTGDANGAGLQIEAKTFFFLPQGLIVNHGCTSVRPMFLGVGDAGTTHITGSIPPGEFDGLPGGIPPTECLGAGGIILTTGGFRSFGGEVRLSGAVNLSNAGNDEITFSCLFILDLEPLRGPPEHSGR